MLSKTINASLFVVALIFTFPAETQAQKFDVSNMQGTWQVDFEKTKAHLETLGLADEVEGVESDVANISITFADNMLVTTFGKEGTSLRKKVQKTFTATAKADGTIEIVTTDGETKQEETVTLTRIDDDHVRFDPQNSIPFVLKRISAEDKVANANKTADLPGLPGDETGELLIGDWRVNLQMTIEWHRKDGMKEEDLAEFQGMFEQTQIGFAKDGTLRMEIGGDEMSDSWKFKSYDSEKKVLHIEMVNMGGSATVTFLDKNTAVLKPDSDYAAVLSRIVEDDAPAKSDDDG